MKKILIVGFGDVAERLVRRYAGQAAFIGMIRRPERAAELRALGVTPIVGDLDAPATLTRLPRVAGARGEKRSGWRWRACARRESMPRTACRWNASGAAPRRWLRGTTAIPTTSMPTIWRGWRGRRCSVGARNASTMRSM